MKLQKFPFRGVAIVLVSTAACIPTYAATVCTNFQYEEMKDMSKEELVKEYCKALRLASENRVEGLEILTRRYSEETASSDSDGPLAMADDCTNQAGRMARVLERKGVDLQGRPMHQAVCTGKK